MYKSLIVIMLFFWVSCNCSKEIYKQNTVSNKQPNFFEITRVDSVHNYYIIYATKKLKMYKIVSQKESLFRGEKIQIGKNYDLNLVSIYNNDNKIAGVSKMPTLHIQCLGLDDSTNVCIEEGYIIDIHKAENLRGLYIVKKG